MGRSDYGESFASLVAFTLDCFGNRKIDQFRVSEAIDHEIFWFNISAYYIIVMEILKYQYDTS